MSVLFFKLTSTNQIADTHTGHIWIEKGTEKDVEQMNAIAAHGQAVLAQRIQPLCEQLPLTKDNVPVVGACRLYFRKTFIDVTKLEFGERKYVWGKGRDGNTIRLPLDQCRFNRESANA